MASIAFSKLLMFSLLVLHVCLRSLLLPYGLTSVPDWFFGQLLAMLCDRSPTKIIFAMAGQEGQCLPHDHARIDKII